MRAIKGKRHALTYRNTWGFMCNFHRGTIHLVSCLLHVCPIGSELSRAIVISDSAVKQILLTMNEKNPFIIEDLDDFHLVIKADEEYRVRIELEAEVRGTFVVLLKIGFLISEQLEKNTYSLE